MVGVGHLVAFRRQRRRPKLRVRGLAAQAQAIELVPVLPSAGHVSGLGIFSRRHIPDRAVFCPECGNDAGVYLGDGKWVCKEHMPEKSPGFLRT